jgi:hypothetical protein
MCLETFKTQPSNDKTGYGWKVFKLKSNRQLRFQFRQHNNSFIVPINKWLINKNKESICTQYGNYHSGFHIFTNYESAVLYENGWSPLGLCIRKVQYKGINVIGKQYSDDLTQLKTLVVREMLVLPKKENE